jgi:ABC-type Fe3+-hydroxamate transport system substrate-binding protein
VHDHQSRALRALRSRSFAGRAQGAAYTQAVRRRPGPVVRVLALVLCALTLAACGAKPEPTSGKLGTTYPASVQDGLNHIITVTAPPRLVLVVSDGPERLLARLGVRAAVAPEGVTVARVRAAHPDLVVVGPGYTSALQQRNDAFIRQLGVPVFVMPGGRLQDIEAGAVALGVLTNHAEAGRSLALSLRKQRERLAQQLSGVAPLSVYVDAGFGTSIQRTTLLARLIALAGAKLVGPADGVTTVNAKSLHRLDPDAYLATDRSGTTLARLRARPGLRALRSVSAGRVFIVDTSAARADTTAYSLMRSLAHALHPSVVKR